MKKKLSLKIVALGVAVMLAFSPLKAEACEFLKGLVWSTVLGACASLAFEAIANLDEQDFKDFIAIVGLTGTLLFAGIMFYIDNKERAKSYQYFKEQDEKKAKLQASSVSSGCDVIV